MNKINSLAFHGENFTIGSFNVIEKNVIIGNNVTIGNGCTICEGTKIGDNVFIGHNVVIGQKCKIESGVEISCGSLINDKVWIGQDAIVSLGGKVLADVLPFAIVQDKEIFSFNQEAVKAQRKELGIAPREIESMSAEAWRLIDYILTHRESFPERIKKELRRAEGLTDGKILRIVCEFALNEERKGKEFCPYNY
ncbi:MAG: DapH/DapD/GlmU-related protein [Alphaproteobacteria bacterium]|nr:DapH/DapD/GlmU-related protein [Alphaproteobacteria bacterium]